MRGRREEIQDSAWRELEIQNCLNRLKAKLVIFFGSSVHIVMIDSN